MTETCCPEFDPSLWDDKVSVWEDKLFMKGVIRQLFHMPLNMGAVISGMFKKMEATNAAVPPKEMLMLAFDPSPWKCEMYVSVTKDVPGSEMAKISGTFVSKVFDGPYNLVPKWMEEMDVFLAGKGKQAKKYYFYYTTCPKCAKKYGHNYVVAFAEV